MLAINRFKACFIPLYLPPITILALSIIGGILWAKLSMPWFIPLSITLFICLYCYFEKISIPLKIPASGLFFTIAIFSYQFQTKQSLIVDWYNQPVTLSGTVTNLEKITASRYSYRATIKLSQISSDQKESPVNETLWIYLQRRPYIGVADVVKISDVKLKPIKNESFKSYLIKEGINHTLFLHKNVIKRTYRPHYSLQRFIHTLKNNIYDRITKKMDRKTGSLFSSIFLGKKTKSKTNDLAREQFKLWGLSHYLARSGLHLVIFIMIWELLLGLFPISFRVKQFICLLLAFTYATLSWSTTSFIRALSTFFIYKISVMTGTQIHPMHVIILIGSILLLINPMLLFFVDFQLSFLFTLALSWVMQSYNNCIRAS